MPALQQLSQQQIDEVLAEAAGRQAPLVVTVQSDGRWVTYHSRLIALRGQHLAVEMPRAEDGTPLELAPADKLNVSLKLKHHKNIFSATVARVETIRMEQGAEMTVAVLCGPTQVQRLQRRAYLRADVPANRIVRASVWLGGWESEPAGTSPDRPVWTGQVTNISAGGFQMKAPRQCLGALEVNDLVGVRLIFGAGQKAVYSDAQFRHAEEDGPSVLLGFQFVGLTETAEGMSALRTITARVSELARCQQHAQNSRSR